MTVTDHSPYHASPDQLFVTGTALLTLLLILNNLQSSPATATGVPLESDSNQPIPTQFLSADYSNRHSMGSTSIQELNDLAQQQSKEDILSVVVSEGNQIDIVRYRTPLKLSVVTSDGAEKKYLATHVLGNFPIFGPANQTFANQILYYATEAASQDNSGQWTEQEVATTTKALDIARRVSAEIYGFDRSYPGVGNPVAELPIILDRHEPPVILAKTPVPPFNDAANGIQPGIIYDTIYIRPSQLRPVNGEPSVDLAGALASEISKHHNPLVRHWIGRYTQYITQTDQMPDATTISIIEGMGAWADYKASGNRWRLTNLSRQRLDASLNARSHDSPFYDQQFIGDNITLAGMAVAEAEERWPGIWGHILARSAREATIAFGGRDSIYDLLWEGKRTITPLKLFTLYGDEYIRLEKGYDAKPNVFTDWFWAQKIFALNKIN